MKPTLALFASALLLPLSPSVAQEKPAEVVPALGEEASITFPSSSTIRTWKADKNHGIWIQDRAKNWYYATFAGYCENANFTPAIGVETRGASRLDRFATLIVGGERCPLSSFVTSAPPPSKKDKEAAKKAQPKN